MIKFKKGSIHKISPDFVERKFTKDLVNAKEIDNITKLLKQGKVPKRLLNERP